MKMLDIPFGGFAGKPVLRLVSTLGIALVIQLGSSQAQQITGTLLGTIYDTQGAVLPQASVTATNANTGQTTSVTTNNQGQYRIEYLPVGDYSLKVSAPGFKLFLQQNIVLTVDQTLRVDANLVIGTASETVTVSSAPPLINLSTPEVSRAVQTDEILGLPLVNRNAYQELSLTPGVQVSSSASNGAAGLGGGNFVMGIPAQQTTINGGFDAGVGSVSYYLDGGINMTSQRNYGNPIPNPDALQEFRVETNNYSAQYGRYSAGVVTVLTRSGTNQFHGSLFEFVRNTAFNATPWGATLNAPYHRNQFGGALGGKIKSDRAFFFFSYAGLRQTTSSLLTGGVVPTALERTGNFSQSAIKPIDPTTGSVYNYDGVPGWIPPSDLDPTAANIIGKYIPQANASGNQWRGYVASPFNTDEYLGKVDEQISANNHLSVSYFTIKSNNTYGAGGSLPWSYQTAFARQQNVNIGDTEPFGGSLVNQIWLTYTRAVGGRLNTPEISLANLGSTFSIQGQPSLPSIAVSGYFTLAQALQGPLNGDNFYAIRDIVSRVSGKHSVDFGSEVSLDKDILVSDLDNWGAFSFATSAPQTTKNVLADFVTGRPASMEQDAPVTLLGNSWYFALFLQDNYRITPRLTVNLGLRYDMQTPPTDPQNKESTFVPGRQSTIIPNAPLGLLYPGDSGITRGIVGLRLHHFSPRVGIAFDPFGNGRTSVRAAAGVFYGSVSSNSWGQSGSYLPFAIRQVFSSIASLTNVYGDKASFPNGDPFPYYYSPSNARFISAATVSATALSYQWPYSYQLNASVQQQLTGSLSTMIAYVATLSHDVPFMTDYNYPAYAPGATNSQASLNSRRKFDPGVLGTIQYLASNQTASYHSLQVSVNKRMSRSFILNGFYVWSHSLWSATPNGLTVGPAQDLANLWEERGAADQDQRNMASISGSWNLDYYRGSKRLVGGVVNGWRISPIVTLNSGNPLNITTGAANNADGYLYDRPNLVPGVSPFLSPHRSRAAVAAAWFNTAAFVPNGPGLGIGPYGVDGNTPRDFLRSPGYKDVDLGIFRTVSLWEHVRLELRAEAINAFNIVSLSPPTATLSSPADGQIRSASTMREIQLGARLTF
jgi:Carboxypeptidase regulatory-like domain